MWDDGYLYICMLISLFAVKFRVSWSCRWRIEQPPFFCSINYAVMLAMYRQKQFYMLSWSRQKFIYAELETATCLDHILLRHS
jgi:hypothetical protein